MLSECTPLERTAIGFGYQQIFGAASNQVHLNMTATYDPQASEHEFLKRIDNLLILVICIILRAVKIAEVGHGQLENACRALRDEFTGALPNSYEGAVIGAAEVDDIVSVFSSPDIFIGIVREKRGGTGVVTEVKANAADKTAKSLRTARKTAITTPSLAATAAVTAAEIAANTAATESAEYVSYNVEPLLNFGRVGRYSDIETQIILKAGDVQSALNDGIMGGVINQGHIDRGIYSALSQLIQHPGAFDRYIQRYMNRANRPYLFFVQRYLRRLIESRAYYFWVDRGRVSGEELRDWTDAEQEVLNR